MMYNYCGDTEMCWAKGEKKNFEDFKDDLGGWFNRVTDCSAAQPGLVPSLPAALLVATLLARVAGECPSFS